MKSFIISIFILFVVSVYPALAEDSIPANVTQYEQRLLKYQKFWNSLIPSQVMIQNAGNMGLLSAGIGWDYGKRDQWETHFMVGFVPKHLSQSTKATITVKENYIPWRKKVGETWSVEPLTCGLYINAILGSNFWDYQPSRYPNNYYVFSTKFRINIFAGQRIGKELDLNSKRAYVKSATLFYEISSCDIYLIDYFKNSDISLIDIIGLSVGLKFQLF